MKPLGSEARLQITPCTPEILAALQAAMPSQHHHARYTAQAAGEGLFLVALVSDMPAGSVLLRWRSTDETLGGWGVEEPYLEALAVAPPRQSRGIGTALVRSAEQAAHERGHITIGLSVGLGNVRARALYRRLGYRESTFGAFDVTWTNRDASGAERVERENCTYFTKRIAT